MKRYEGLIEDVADFSGLSMSRIYVLTSTNRNFPRPRRDGIRSVYDMRAVKRYFKTRVDGRTVEGRAKAKRRRK
ncbi:MAG: hypothetical protein J0H40_04020 [Rhizobiales bacterium]|nr:hypothetical protein [Hyphomicrobiales bacterium]